MLSPSQLHRFGTRKCQVETLIFIYLSASKPLFCFTYLQNTRHFQSLLVVSAPRNGGVTEGNPLNRLKFAMEYFAWPSEDEQEDENSDEGNENAAAADEVRDDDDGGRVPDEDADGTGGGGGDKNVGDKNRGGDVALNRLSCHADDQGEDEAKGVGDGKGTGESEGEDANEREDERGRGAMDVDDGDRCDTASAGTTTAMMMSSTAMITPKDSSQHSMLLALTGVREMSRCHPTDQSGSEDEETLDDDSGEEGLSEDCTGGMASKEGVDRTEWDTASWSYWPYPYWPYHCTPSAARDVASAHVDPDLVGHLVADSDGDAEHHDAADGDTALDESDQVQPSAVFQTSGLTTSPAPR